VDVVKWVRVQWDRAGAWVAVALGLIALTVGWVGTSGTAYPAEQIPYVISGGLLGLFLLGVGGMLWLTADLRDEWRKLDDIERALLANVDALHAAQAAQPVREAPSRRRPSRAPADL
jgi:hypothetical protein